MRSDGTKMHSQSRLVRFKAQDLEVSPRNPVNHPDQGKHRTRFRASDASTALLPPRKHCIKPILQLRITFLTLRAEGIEQGTSIGTVSVPFLDS